MPLWGTTATAATNKPKWCPDDANSDYDITKVYATQSGWVRRPGTAASGNNNTSAQEEVLVAIGGLAGSDASTGLQEATITNTRFIIGSTAATDLTAGSSSQTIEIEITWDEAVTVTGSPSMKVVSGNEGTGSGRGPYECVYTATGSTANQLRFILASQTLVEDDVLSIGTALHDAVALNGDPSLNKFIIEKLKGINKNLKIFEISYTISNIEKFNKNSNYVIFSGIANSGNFLKILKQNNFKINKEFIYPDHHTYSNNELEKIINYAKESNAKIITTEKDYYKLDRKYLNEIMFLKLDLKIYDQNNFLKFIKSKNENN